MVAAGAAGDGASTASTAPRVLQALLLLLGPPGARVPLASPQLPRAPPNWALNRSTVIMPCNSTGLLDPATTAGWAVVDFDVRLAFFWARFLRALEPSRHNCHACLAHRVESPHGRLRAVNLSVVELQGRGQCRRVGKGTANGL
eukprot:COSAG02_NODE_4254_length_5581_cov_2.070595_6_plen_144_part_00